MVQTQSFTPAEAAALTNLSEKDITLFLTWKENLVSVPDTMGGTATFPNSRLTVSHVGGMLKRGVDTQEILEDYPYLSVEDSAFSHLFVRAYPDIDHASAAR